MSPIIFLDIDGVIVLQGSSANVACSKCVDMLNEVVEETEADIVVSSNRRVAGMQYIKFWLDRWGVNKEPIGLTPDLKGMGVQALAGDVTKTRGDEIVAWMVGNYGHTENWPEFVVFDDDPFGLGHPIFNGRFLQTKPDIGITRGLASIAIDVLEHGQEGIDRLLDPAYDRVMGGGHDQTDLP